MSKILMGNLITCVAVIFVVIAYQCKEHKKLLVFNTISTSIYILQYAVLGGMSGALMNAVLILRNFVSYRYDLKNKKPGKIIVGLFVALIIILQIITYNGWISLIPCIGVCACTVTIFIGSDKMIRYADIFACLIFVIYNYDIKAYVCVVTTLFEATSSFIYLIRMRKNPEIK